jgi:preprotein translocase subunit SecB
VISDLITKGGFPNFLLPLVNFEALFAQAQQSSQQTSQQPNLVN